MNPAATAVQENAAGEEIFVVSRTADGFSVYSPSDPRTQFTVRGSPEHPTCNCPDFAWRGKASDWHCPHIQAVLGEMNGPKAAVEEAPSAPPSAEGPEPSAPPLAGSPEQMTLKRSVSPDGRINSLSVEFACPLGEGSEEEVRNRALRALDLQEKITGAFLHQRNGGGQKPAPVQAKQDSAPVPAQLGSVDGQQTRYGWRMFIGVKVNGQVYKLFGKRQELGVYLAQAGYSNFAGNVSQGMHLDLPCRAVLKPSQDGKYTNVVRLLPVNGAPAREEW